MKKLFLFFILLSVCVFVYALKIEPNKFVVRYETLYLPYWQQEFDGLKVALISDLHVGSSNVSLKVLNKVVAKVNENNPDIIFLLGDLDAKAIVNSEIEPNDISKSLSDFKSKYLTVSVMGNHDYEPSGVVRGILNDARISLLENSSKTIQSGTNRLKVVGLKDLWHYNVVPDAEIGNISSNTSVILLSHNPDIFPDVPKTVSLILSGHTHGGEVYLPVVGAPMVPSKYAQRYRKGLIVEDNKFLYVTSGVGTLSHLRLLNPPEIVILTLYHQTPETKIENTKPQKGFHRNYIPYYRKISNYIKHLFSRNNQAF